MFHAARTRRGIAFAGAMALAGYLALAPIPAAVACQDGVIAERAGAAFLGAARAASAQAFATALAKHTDMQQITLFALGKYRKLLPPGRQSELVQLTAKYVSTTLADFALKFRGSAITTIECRPGQVVSRIEFLGGKPAKRVLWRLDGNKVTDVNVQNVWLGQLLRDNYASVIRKGGSIEALFAHLGAKQPNR